MIKNKKNNKKKGGQQGDTIVLQELRKISRERKEILLPRERTDCCGDAKKGPLAVTKIYTKSYKISTITHATLLKRFYKL